MIQTLQLVPEYKEELIYPAICKSMEALGIEKELQTDFKVVIKPNMVMAKSPDFPVTTHPLVVKCVARWLREHGVTNIILAESSGGLYNAEQSVSCLWHEAAGTGGFSEYGFFRKNCQLS